MNASRSVLLSRVCLTSFSRLAPAQSMVHPIIQNITAIGDTSNLNMRLRIGLLPQPSNGLRRIKTFMNLKSVSSARLPERAPFISPRIVLFHEEERRRRFAVRLTHLLIPCLLKHMTFFSVDSIENSKASPENSMHRCTGKVLGIIFVQLNRFKPLTGRSTRAPFMILCGRRRRSQ